jgi:hypothetical protein
MDANEQKRERLLLVALLGSASQVDLDKSTSAGRRLCDICGDRIAAEKRFVAKR